MTGTKLSPKTASGIPIKEIYTPQDIRDIDYEKDLNDAGLYPFTRGRYKGMFRNQKWGERMLVGFGTPADTRERLKKVIAMGQKSFCFIGDIPTEMGIDSDHPMAQKEVGLEGCPLCSLACMEELFDGIDILKHTIEPAYDYVCGPVYFSQLMAYTDKYGIDPRKVRGFVSTNPLNFEPWGQLHPHPIDLTYKISIDLTEYITRQKMDNMFCFMIHGYQMAESGIKAHEELALTFAIAIQFLEDLSERGIGVEDIAWKAVFHLQTGMEFFEEIAKIRAARRMWARMMKEKYGLNASRSLVPRFSVRTAGDSLYPQQPLNNIVRGSLETLSAVLAGVTAIEPCAYDEPLCEPTEESSRISLNTQHIIYHETGVCNTADPLGGSYYVEHLTSTLEKEANHIIKEVEDMGGMMEAYKTGYTEALRTKNALAHQKALERKEKIIVGVNKYMIPPEKDQQVNLHITPPESSKRQVERIINLKKTRDNVKVKEALERLKEEAPLQKKINLIPAMIEATKAYVTLGEIWGVIREANGYRYDPFDAS